MRRHAGLACLSHQRRCAAAAEPHVIGPDRGAGLARKPAADVSAGFPEPDQRNGLAHACFQSTNAGAQKTPDELALEEQFSHPGGIPMLARSDALRPPIIAAGRRALSIPKSCGPPIRAATF
jgi:hypothetical protein